MPSRLLKQLDTASEQMERWTELLDQATELLNEAEVNHSRGLLDATIQVLHGLRAAVNAAEELVQAERMDLITAPEE